MGAGFVQVNRYFGKESGISTGGRVALRNREQGGSNFLTAMNSRRNGKKQKGGNISEPACVFEFG